MNYTYDGDGKRAAKSNGKLYWYGTSSDALVETDASGIVTDEYVFFGGKRIARRKSPSGEINYYFSDHLGSSRVITSATGSILDDSDFYPFGGERTIASSSGNAYKFTGKERDTESGLDFFIARYYSSGLGRFTSVDPIKMKFDRLVDPQRLNLYTYVGNNPLNAYDPDGRDLKLAAGLSNADKNRVIKNAVALYRKESGRKALEQLHKSDIKFTVGTGDLPSKTNLMEGTLQQTFGETNPVGFTGTMEGGKVTSVNRTSGVVAITLDFEARDAADRSSERGERARPPSEQEVFGHEIGHGTDFEADPVAERNKTQPEAEAATTTFVKQTNKAKDTISKKEAEKRVREILNEPKDKKP